MEGFFENFYELMPSTHEALSVWLMANDHVLPSNHGFVYLMRMGKTDIYKIGMSSSPERRLKEIKRTPVVMPDEITLSWYWRTPHMNLSEAMLHERFSAARLNGEWFRLSSENLSWLVSTSGHNFIQSCIYAKAIKDGLRLSDPGNWRGTAQDVEEEMRVSPEYCPENFGVESLGLMHSIACNYFCDIALSRQFLANDDSGEVAQC